MATNVVTAMLTREIGEGTDRDTQRLIYIEPGGTAKQTERQTGTKRHTDKRKIDRQADNGRTGGRMSRG